MQLYTGLVGVRDAVKEDGDEPLEWVLVHRIDVGQVGHAEEQNLSVDGHWDVLAASHVNVSLCLLRDLHFRLSKFRRLTMTLSFISHSRLSSRIAE